MFAIPVFVGGRAFGAMSFMALVRPHKELEVNGQVTQALFRSL